MKRSHRQSMPFERGSSHPAFLLLVAAAVAIATAPGIVKADVLYDTTDMTDNQTYNHSHPSFIGGFAQFGQFRDEGASDDFELSDLYDITSVTGDFLNFTPDAFPADGVLVEFFEDIGGMPSEVPSAAALTTAVIVTPFEDSVFGNHGVRVMVDLSDSAITLGAGTWWLSIVPVDETPSGVSYAQVRTVSEKLIGEPGHVRDGGLDHGNGYPGGAYGTNDWLPSIEIGLPNGDLAMKIEGTPVKPACPWDLDDNGSVGVSDLLSLLANWGPCKGCPADFDGGGTVGVSDLLVLLANWGPCP